MFTKKDNDELIIAPNFVLNANYELVKEKFDTYTYPVDGWYWFETEDEAYLYFGLEKPVEEVSDDTRFNRY